MPNVRRTSLPHSGLTLLALLTLLTVTLGGDPLAAVNHLGDRGGACVTLAASGTHVITMTHGTTVDGTLFVIGMVSGGAGARATPVQDLRANAWVLTHTYTAVNGSRPFIY